MASEAAAAAVVEEEAGSEVQHEEETAPQSIDTQEAEVVSEDLVDEANSKLHLESQPSGMEGSSAMYSKAAATEMVLKASKTKPRKGQSRADFLRTITHLHLAGQGLVGDLELLKICPGITVLYVYDNKLTSLRGIGGMQRLKGLYAQNNQIQQLDDFVCPPALQQLFLNGNRLSHICGLNESRQLRELNLSSQRHHAGEASEVSIEQESIWRIASTLESLDMSSCGLTDNGLKELVVLQGLQTLDVSKNDLTSVELMQLIVLRLPRLQKLKIAGNAALMSTPKWREKLVLASERLESLDDKAVTPHERQFLQSLANRSQRKGPRDGAKPANDGSGPDPRGVAIDARPSFELKWEGLGVVRAPGLNMESDGPGAAMPRGTTHFQQ